MPTQFQEYGPGKGCFCFAPTRTAGAPSTDAMAAGDWLQPFAVIVEAEVAKAAA